MSTRAHYVPKFYLAGFAGEHPAAARQPSLWVFDLARDRLTRRAPKNLAVRRAFYDGVGAHDDGSSLEDRLSTMENAAARALREFVARPAGRRGHVPPEVRRFLAWQASRTPSMRRLYQKWAIEETAPGPVAEPPPDGWERIRPRERDLMLRDPSGLRTERVHSSQAEERMREGWHLEIGDADFHEMAEVQAWYFGVRHFPRLRWRILDAPAGASFVTSDRPCAWGFDGLLDAPPSSLRHRDVQVLAPLTRRVALLGVHADCDPSTISPPTAGAFNAGVARFAEAWIAGPTKEAVVAAAQARGS